MVSQLGCWRKQQLLSRPFHLLCSINRDGFHLCKISLITVPMQGDLSDPNNYHVISLLPIASIRFFNTFFLKDSVCSWTSLTINGGSYLGGQTLVLSYQVVLWTWKRCWGTQFSLISSKCFIVCHTSFLFKSCQALVERPHTMCWISSYLYNRSQKVSVASRPVHIMLIFLFSNSTNIYLTSNYAWLFSHLIYSPQRVKNGWISVMYICLAVVISEASM